MTITPKTALEIILDWSQKRPLWLQDAVRQIVKNGMPDNDAIDELVKLCMSNHGLSESGEAQPFSSEDASTSTSSSQSTILLEISAVTGVNQLAAAQNVRFGSSGLTVIYGANGSGKSGYTRILKRACNARNRGQIMPDAFSEASGDPATAKIKIQHDNTDEVVDWIDSETPIPRLHTVSIFDRECAASHLSGKNEVLFRPFGLDIPDDLATVATDVKSILEQKKQRVEEKQDPIFENPIWGDESDIGQFLNLLIAETDADDFPSHLPLSEQEVAKLSQLQVDLAKDPAKAEKQYLDNANLISQLVKKLRSIKDKLSDDVIESVFIAREEASTARKTAVAAAESAFSNLKLSGVGETVWQELWEAARRYSKAQEEPADKFPPDEGQSCLLCQQPITSDAASRMKSFEDFIQQDTETQASRLERTYSELRDGLQNIRIVFQQYGSEFSILKEPNPKILRAVRKFLAIARARRSSALMDGDADNIQNLIPFPLSIEIELDAVVTELHTHAANLAASVEGSERKALLAQLQQLKDRSEHVRLKAIAEAEINRLKELKALEKCISECSTSAITRLGNSIADETITPAMRDRFHEEIVKLAAHRVKVEIARTGGKAGSPQYEVKFLANKKAKVSAVLSEGEQTCVALAAHLTELTNEKTGSALVFDDPVTSLDHRWRRSVAKRLVEESANRQVIVFTHDLILVNDLSDMANDQSIPTHLGSLERTSDGCGVYSDNLPWRAAGLRQRIDELQKQAREAKSHFDAEEDEAYRRVVKDVYDNLRSAWERGLEDRVFAGVIVRHRDYINANNLKRVVALDVNDVAIYEANFSKCSDYVTGHDPSRGRDDDVPSPQDLLDDIQVLANWDESLKVRQNAIVSGSTSTSRPRIRVVE